MNWGLIAVLGVGIYGLYLSNKQATATTTGSAQSNSLLQQIANALKNPSGSGAAKPSAGSGGGSSGGGSGGGSGAGGAGTAGQPGSGETNFLDWLNLANPNQTIDTTSTPSTDTTLLQQDTTPIDDSGIYATVDPFASAPPPQQVGDPSVDTSGEDNWQSDYVDPSSVDGSY